jgi:diacylglycerol kinase family enzyme
MYLPVPVRTTVIINAASGAATYSDEWTNSLAEKFRASGFDAQVVLAKSGQEIIETAQAAVRQRFPIVVAGGGDGTINAVAGILADTDVLFGVLPLGTLNHFAKDLRIPLDLDEAIRTIAEANSIPVDTGEVNGRIFVNNSSLGIYPDIVRSREKQQKRLDRSKWVAFFRAAITALRRYPFLHVRLQLNGAQHVRRTPFVFIGNNEYLMEGFHIGVRECLNAGQLSLYVAHRTSRFGLLKLAIRALFGRLRQAKDFDALLAAEIVVETRHRRLLVATDGEVNVMETPLRYRVRPGALRVIVPRNAVPGPTSE